MNASTGSLYTKADHMQRFKEWLVVETQVVINLAFCAYQLRLCGSTLNPAARGRCMQLRDKYRYVREQMFEMDSPFTVSSGPDPCMDSPALEKRKCTFWRKVGECSASPAFMLLACRRKCMACKRKHGNESMWNIALQVRDVCPSASSSSPTYSLQPSTLLLLLLLPLSINAQNKPSHAQFVTAPLEVIERESASPALPQLAAQEAQSASINATVTTAVSEEATVKDVEETEERSGDEAEDEEEGAEEAEEEEDPHTTSVMASLRARGLPVFADIGGRVTDFVHNHKPRTQESFQQPRRITRVKRKVKQWLAHIHVPHHLGDATQEFFALMFFIWFVLLCLALRFLMVKYRPKETAAPQTAQAAHGGSLRGNGSKPARIHEKV